MTMTTVLASPVGAIGSAFPGPADRRCAAKPIRTSAPMAAGFESWWSCVTRNEFVRGRVHSYWSNAYCLRRDHSLVVGPTLLRVVRAEIDVAASQSHNPLARGAMKTIRRKLVGESGHGAFPSAGRKTVCTVSARPLGRTTRHRQVCTTRGFDEASVQYTRQVSNLQPQAPEACALSN